MKKKILSLCCALLLTAGLFGISYGEVRGGTADDRRLLLDS